MHSGDPPESSHPLAGAHGSHFGADSELPTVNVGIDASTGWAIVCKGQMMDDNYEDLTACGLSDELEQELLHKQRECTFMWTNKAGEAFGVIMSYLPHEGTLWLTAAERRARISAIRRFPRASVCITSTGTDMGTGKTVTYKGECIVHSGRDVKDWFYPRFARWIRPNDEVAATTFQTFLDSPDRVIIEFRPDDKLGFDSALMWARSPEAGNK